MEWWCRPMPSEDYPVLSPRPSRSQLIEHRCRMHEPKTELDRLARQTAGTFSLG